LPSGWDPSKNFPVLADGLVSELGYSSPALLLDSSGALDLPPGYPDAYDLPPLPPGTVQTGLGLKATLAPPSGGQGLAWLMGGRSRSATCSRTSRSCSA
jgi:hypothetical protein